MTAFPSAPELGFWPTGDRTPARARLRLPSFEGIPPERFWALAHRAHVSLATVMAVAGGYETPGANGEQVSPRVVAKVRAAARAMAGGAT